MKARQLLRPLLSLSVLALLGLWVARTASTQDFGQALERLPAWALLAGYFLGGFNLTLGAIRWRVLMEGFGARTLASRGDFLLATFVCHFYNTFVPGAFGGDLVRGFVTRKSFDQPATGLIVVFFERFVGLLALSAVALIGILVGPAIVDYRALAPWIGGVAGVGLLAIAAAAVTGKLNRFRNWLPRLERPRKLVPAVAISLFGHGVNLGIYTLLALAMDLPVDSNAIVLVVPLSLIATVVPISVAGVGAREATLVGLLGLLGVPAGDALVYSLGFALTGIGLAVTGGIILLVQPKVLRYH